MKLKRFAMIDDNPEQSQIMLKKLDDMVAYSELQTCRRQYLLNYFDEEFPVDALTGLANCGSCDVCLTEVKKFDGTEIAQKLLSDAFDQS